jgi:hypothetical protein
MVLCSNFSPATFPDTEYLGRDLDQLDLFAQVWLGGRCEGAKGECHRDQQKKPWKWIGGGEISYDLKYWSGYPLADAEPQAFTEPGCILFGSAPFFPYGPAFYGHSCELDKIPFLCQF